MMTLRFRLPNRLFLIGCLALSFSTISAMAQTPKIRKQTFTYKHVGDLEIKLDVHRADDDLKRKVVVWIHGGALINGGRQGISSRVKKDMLGAGYALVSIDYRLAPETQLPGIIEDLEDAFKWIRKEGPRRFNADVSKIAVLGGSAGGCLTLASGYRVQPPPDALVSFWGYGDLIGPWYSQPSPHPRHNRSKIDKAIAMKTLSGPPVANASDRKLNGGLFYQYCRQQGVWPKLVSGFDPHTEPEKFFPYMAVKNVTNKYPPTLMIHGTKDTDVPHEQSLMMAEQFRKHDVPHRLISIENAEHGLGGGDRAAIEAAYAAVLPFVRKHLGD